MIIAELEEEERRILARLAEIGAAKTRLSDLTPNAETVAALTDGSGETFHGTTEEAFAKMLAEDDTGTDGQGALK